MTNANRIRATGSGTVRFIIAIEGVRYRFCNSESDVSYNAADTQGTWTLGGLNTKGWVFTEHIDLIAAEIASDAVRVEIADLDSLATTCFDNTPSGSYLNGDLTDTDETITVLDTANWPDMPALVYIGTETVLCDGSTSTELGSPGNTTRGYHRSYATYHYGYGGTETDAFVPVTNGPTHFEGRRVEFFAYDIGETSNITETGTGGDEPFWVGIISTEPEFDGATWSFSVDPLWSRFKQMVATGVGDPLSIRGIYYPASAPLTLSIAESVFAYADFNTQGYTEFAMSGFWETQDEFCAALSTQIANYTTGSPGPLSGSFTQTIGARPSPDGRWSFTLQSHSATPHYIMIKGLAPGGAISPLDGVPSQLLTIDGRATANVVASKFYELPIDPQPGLDGHGTVPRAYYGASTIGPMATARMPGRLVSVDESVNTSSRIYLTGTRGLGVGTAVQIDWDANGTGLAVSSEELQSIRTTDTSTGSIVVIANPSTPGALPSGEPRGLVATAANQPGIRLGVALGGGTLATLFDTITTGARQFAPLGVLPMLRTSEVQTTDLITAAYGSRLAQRIWILFGEKSLEEIVKQELRLLGCIPTIGSNGQIAFKRLRFVADGEVASVTLTESDFLHENAKFYKLQRAPYGLANLWTLKTGYSAKQETYLGQEIRVIDLESRANSGRLREIAIAPFSSELQAGFDMISDAERLASNVLGVLGGPYKTMTCRVPLTRLGVASGSVISITWAKPPNGHGGKGLARVQGILVGRAIHIRAAYIEWTILLTDQRVAGYSPGAKITSITGASGSTGSFTVTLSADYFKVTDEAEDHWDVGDKIRVFRWNDATPGIVTGTVTAKSGMDITWTSDAAWTHAGSSWIIGSQVSTSVSSAKQKRYAYIANASGVVEFADEDLSPYTFA